MTDSRKIQLEAGLDASGVDQGFARIQDGAKRTAGVVAAEGDKAAAGVEKIGDSATRAAGKREQAERSIIASIQRRTAVEEAGGRSTRAFYESLAAQRGVSGAALQPYLDALEAAQARTRALAATESAAARARQAAFATGTAEMNQMGTSARATAAAMRGVPAQITDIVVSLQSGQQPMTVLLQQGGQLKDMFGGVGAAARALGTAFVGMLNPVTLLAAGVGAIALAYYQGSQEADAYNKALALSGNASGTTAGQLQRMAAAMADGARTQSASSAALAEMAQNSRVGADSLQRYTTVAMEWERTTGESVSKTAGAFKELEQAPLKASLKLNEGLNYLTTSTYQHIRALEEQGRSVDAARVAQETYATALANRTGQITQNQGSIERGWKAITGAAKAAWDAMLNIGRPQTAASQLEAARTQLDQRMQRGPLNDLPWARAAWEKGNEGLRQQIALMGEQERMLKRGAEADAERARQVEARTKWDERVTQSLGNQAKLEREINKIRAEGAAAGIAQKEIDAQIAAARERLKDKGGSKAGSAAPGENELARIRAMIAEEQAYTKALQERGTEADKLTSGEKLVMKLQEELQTSIKGTARARKESALAAAQELVTVQKANATLKEEAKARADIEQAQKRFENARAGYLQSLDAETRAMQGQNVALEDEIARIGLTGRALVEHERARNNSTIARKQEKLAIMEMMGATADETQAIREQIATLEKRNALLGQRADVTAAVEAQKQIADEAKRTSDQINQSLTDALLRGFEGGKDFAKNFKDTLINMFKTLVLRPVISFIVRPIGNAISGIVSGLLGGGGSGAGGIGSMVSNGSSLLNLFNGGGSNLATMFGFGEVGAGSIFDLLGSSSMGALDIGGVSAGAIGGLAAIAAPLIIGAIAEGNMRDRIGGAAYATSGGNDPMRDQVRAGATGYDPRDGYLPDREAMLAALRDYGATDEVLAGASDRQLATILASARAEADSGREGGPMYNWRTWRSNFDNTDFYRGPGYTDPESEGFWRNKGPEWEASDPRVTAASRSIAESIVGPMSAIERALGGTADDIRATVGIALRGKGGSWAALDIRRGDEELLRMVDTDDNGQGYGGAMRSIYSSALDAFKKLDLPEWARSQVDAARAAMDKLTGDKVGEEAAAIYASASTSIAQTITRIQTLIDVFPNFSNASQDAVHSIATLVGGLDNLQSAYSSYLQNYYSDSERAALATKQLGLQFAALDLEMPATREGFRALVDAQDLTTESGRETFAALMGLAGAFAEVTGAANASFGASQELASAIQAGLLGTFDGGNLGATMAQTVQDGIYTAIAGGFANQITSIIVSGVVEPVIAAAMAGSTISAAVSQASIDEMVARAQAVANAAAQVLSDPAFQAAIEAIGSAVSSIKIPAGSYIKPTANVGDYTRAVGNSGDVAERAADQVQNAWKSIADSLIEEVKRIRGELADAGQQSLSYWQAQFAIDSAAARAGDQDAAGRLTGLSRSLLSAAEAQADSMLELQQIRASVAQSLQDTAGYATARAGSAAAGGTTAAQSYADVIAGLPPWMRGDWTAIEIAMRQAGIGSAAPSATPPAPPLFSPPALAVPPVLTPGASAAPVVLAADPDLLAELRDLKEQNKEQNRVIADLQLQLLRIARRWDEEGMPAEREETV